MLPARGCDHADRLRQGPTITVGAPVTIVADDPVSLLMSPSRAAGLPPMSTVVDPVTIGAPTWGTGGVPLDRGQVV